MQHTFRPPWFHRNVASEFMGLSRARTTRRRAASPRGRLAAQLHERPRTGRGNLRAGLPRRYADSRALEGHDGVHVRDRAVICPTAHALGVAAAADGITRRAGRTCRGIFALPRSCGMTAASMRRTIPACAAGWKAPIVRTPIFPSRIFRSAYSGAPAAASPSAVGVAIGDQVLDLRALRGRGLPHPSVQACWRSAAGPI